MHDQKPSIQVSIYPSTHGLETRMTVHVPDRVSGPLTGDSDLLPLAIVLAQYRLEAKRHPEHHRIQVLPHVVDEMTFDAAWHFLNNAMRDNPVVRMGLQLNCLRDAIRHRFRAGIDQIEFDGDLLPETNVGFRIQLANGGQLEFDSSSTETELAHLIGYLNGRRTLTDLVVSLDRGRSGSVPPDQFRFGGVSTLTTVVRRFADGLPVDAVHAEILDKPYRVPAEIDALIARVHELLQSNAPGLVAVKDQPMLAPRSVVLAMDNLDDGVGQLRFQLAPSSYRHYIAFVAAERLVGREPSLRALLEFVRAGGDAGQPSPATASIGVRVLVETSDNQLVVSYRGDGVKMNPNMWSVSANEGVRTSLLATKLEEPHLFERAVDKALANELHLTQQERQTAVLLSVYHNHWNQWGAGFYVKVEIPLDEVIARQPGARHGWEHARLAGLPVQPQACGSRMRDLGVRWYGGALETICAALAWRRRADGHFESAEEIGRILSDAAGGGIMPVDEIHPRLLPTVP